MLINKILDRDYLQGRNKTKLLAITAPFPLLIVLSWLISMLVGNHLLPELIGMGTVSLLLMVPFIILKQDELTIAYCIAVSIYVDWYLDASYVALGLIIVLLLIRYLTRSSQRIWIFPRARGFWLLLLFLTIFPALRGYTLIEGINYYLTVFFAAFLFFWLGTLISKNINTMRNILKFLAALGAIIAIHALIQSVTKVSLFASAHVTQYLDQISDYHLSSSTSSIIRAGSFFINPDWSGAFFATMLFIPLGLFFESSSRREKALYGSEALLTFLGLLASYSTGAWVAAVAALLVFLILFGNKRSRLMLLLGFLLISGALVALFPSQVEYQLRHLTQAGSFPLRFAAWQTATRVIQAFPLTGLGLGLHAYLYRAEPFRVAAQFMKLAHPHDSYLEIAAMAGLPVLFMFITLLLVTFWWALHNWKLVDVRTRSLFAGSIAAITALSVNSISINEWTLAPLLALGWLILGVISSPLLTNSLRHSINQVKMSEEKGEKRPDEIRERSFTL